MNDKNMKKLIGKKIDNILFSGFVYHDEYLVFTPNMNTIFFQFNDYYLMFDGRDDDLQVKASFTSEILFDYQIYDDEKYALSEEYNSLLTNSFDDHFIDDIIIYGMERECDNIIKFSGMEILLSSHQILFIDGYTFNGLNIGGIEQKLFWLSHEENENCDTLSVGQVKINKN